MEWVHVDKVAWAGVSGKEDPCFSGEQQREAGSPGTEGARAWVCCLLRGPSLPQRWLLGSSKGQRVAVYQGLASPRE